MGNLASAVAFVDASIKAGGRALVHCAAGISRSSTIVLAYLVAHHNVSLRRAFELTRQARPVVWPNLGFMRILLRWEIRLRGTATIRLPQYELWTSYDTYQYDQAKLVDRD